MEVKLLDEHPVYEDKLGVHKNIANTIREIINDITSQDKGKKKNIIGLFGTWGVGKSTVINILERESYEDFEVFKFDSWSHKDEFLKEHF